MWLRTNEAAGKLADGLDRKVPDKYHIEKDGEPMGDDQERPEHQPAYALLASTTNLINEGSHGERVGEEPGSISHEHRRHVADGGTVVHRRLH